MILGIDGDFDPAQMEAKLRQAFGDLPRGEAAPRNVAETPMHPASPGVYFVEKNDVNQSNVRLIHLGIERNNPDYYAVTVMNEVLGGGFSGRLIQNLRTKAGLAYDVHGGIGAGYDHPGIFQLVMETKSGTTAAATEGLLGQLDDIKLKPATEAELKRAKETILNSFIFDFDSKDKVLAERMTYEFYGYPPDFLERFRAGIEKVTAADVERVARKYVHKDQMAIFVLGNSADFDKQLSTFGKVTPMDISIPETPPGKSAAAQPGTE
jgi:zinc protease